MAEDLRDTLLRRLAEDLVGPDAPDEILADRPIDRYLTGIVFPQRTETAPEDQDEGAADAADGAEEAGSDTAIPHTGVRKPASIGLSFRLQPLEGDRSGVRIPVEVTGGRYERFRQKGDNRVPNERTADDPLAQAADVQHDPAVPETDGTRARALSGWKRSPALGRYVVQISDAGKASVEIVESGGLDGFCVHPVIVASGDEWVITIALVNTHDLADPDEARTQDELALFQAALRVDRPDGWRFNARPPSARFDDEDSRTAALIYRDVKEYAVGHTCSAVWLTESSGEVDAVGTTWLPEVDVPLVSAEGGPPLVEAIREVSPQGLLASLLARPDVDTAAILQAVPDGYARWIMEQQDRIRSLPESLRPQAEAHLETCRIAERRIRDGIECIIENADCLAAFRLMNQAMALQREWSVRGGTPLKWRPFQMAFILQTVKSLANRKSPDREIMDLLWFPTGGGKTEAYLGLIAFVLFLRRIRAGKASEGAGVACLMRYTLRLLTLQQFERAATLIMACEYIRRRAPGPDLPDLTTAAEMSIGLWVGGGATPNTMEDAVAALGNPNAPSSPSQLTACPCCGRKLKWEASDDKTDIVVRCPGGEECDLATVLARLPVLTVDELIYDRPPSLLIGTIDKFAQLVRKAESRSLFRSGTAAPPELIIQDELHLISGPLGSMAGLYEAAIDRLTVHEGRPAKIIGSTATIRRAADQVRSLFNRSVAQFPPPGLDAGDSCFAVVPLGAQVRRYVGMTTAGRSAKFTLQAAYASLLQGASSLPEERRDGYYTLVGYFNALRELGGALPLVQDDALSSIGLIARRRGETPRAAREVEELTSRVSQSDIRRVLNRLQQPSMGGEGDEDPVDVLLATNMMSVGVDVSRLGLMVVMGQPKTASEYIQATSRVGRDVRMPGVVLTVFNNNKTRDRSHFETFTSWHRALYRGVEATSVTPFASRARDKALHAALILMARHLVPGMQESPRLDADHEEGVRELAESLFQRIASVDETEEDAAREEVDEIISLWRDRSHVLQWYWNDSALKKSLLVAAEKAAARHLASRSVSHSWPTLNAMRNVEPSTQVRLVEALSDEF